MMQVNDIEWSTAEQTIAEAAFKKAYEREINALLAEVRSQASSVLAQEDLWRLHDFLSARRHDLDGKYDYRYSVLTFVFARLVKEGWLQLSELDGLEPAKLTKVSALTRI
jgi:Photoprotection regulator fluorescence recovery protein